MSRLQDLLDAKKAQQEQEVPEVQEQEVPEVQEQEVPRAWIKTLVTKAAEQEMRDEIADQPAAVLEAAAVLLGPEADADVEADAEPDLETPIAIVDKVLAADELERQTHDLLGNSPNIDVPTISSSAVQVTVSFSQCAFRRFDKDESERVTTANGAVRKAASVHKALLPNCKELQAIKDFVSATRTAHYSMTLPWCDQGPRLLPTANLPVFHKHITEIQDKFNSLCEEFYVVYAWEKVQAEADLGTSKGLFDADAYPSLEEVKKKFRMSVAYMPVPERGSFITDLQADALELANDHYDEFYHRATVSAMDEVWKKLFVPLQNMSQRLDYSTRAQNTKFRDTLVSNVVDIVSLLKVFNVTNDPHLEACRVKLEEAMYGVTPDALRNDDIFRAQTKRSVDAVLKTLPSLDM
tara:strand:- start:2227 stop:3453 length:1227 start_codon:yes stop_codon:yes gene_type:complete